MVAMYDSFAHQCHANSHGLATDGCGLYTLCCPRCQTFCAIAVVRLNPQGFAGPYNHNIDTQISSERGLLPTLKLISRVREQQRACHNVEYASHIAINSPNIWSTGVVALQPREPYIKILEPVIMASLQSWPHERFDEIEMGLR